jgi:hypothetical protein
MYNNVDDYSRRKDYDMGLESELMTTKEASELWGITTRRVQVLCDKGKVQGAVRMGRTWIIPKGTPKPIDGRTKAAKIVKVKINGDEG